MKISVLINTYNRKTVLAKTLDLLLAQDYPAGELEIIILDDFGEDGTYDALTGKSPVFMAHGYRAFRPVRNERNMGIAYGRGFLTRAAAPNSEALLYLDDDVYLEKDTISGLAACLLKDPSRGLAGPRLVYASAPERTAHCANFVGKWSGRYYESDPSSELDCDWLNSSCFLVRRTAISGLVHADGFYTTHEEVDFCLQLKAAGYSVVYCPAVKAAHDLPLSGAGRRGRLYYIYRNKLLVFRRNFTPVRAVAASLFMLVFGLPRYLLDSVSYNRGLNLTEIKLIFRALSDGLRGRDGRL
jgi:GT2 family glycosyltransferase